MIIVTAASENHWAPLRNLLASLRFHEPETPVLVYDLGLKSPCDVPTKRFDFERYPPHVANLRSYAWKPIIIAEVLELGCEPVLWLDAGNLVMRPLSAIRRELDRWGIYSPVSSGTIGDWTHPTTLARLGAGPDLKLRRNRSGGLVGFGPGWLDFVQLWRACALDPDTITPPGSSRQNHRQDQAVLSVLYYQHVLRAEALAVNKLDVTTHNDHLTIEEAARACGISS